MKVIRLGALLGALAVSCADPPRPTDTGYVGTWRRANDRAASIVAIVKTDAGYAFRWTKRSYVPDGTLKLVVDCGWDGRCIETLEGVEQARYDFRTWIHPDTGRLMVEGNEIRTVPERLELHFIDELVVEPGGQVLWSYTAMKNGQTFEGGGRPMRSFRKVSDGVADPPR